MGSTGLRLGARMKSGYNKIPRPTGSHFFVGSAATKYLDKVGMSTKTIEDAEWYQEEEQAVKFVSAVVNWASENGASKFYMTTDGITTQAENANHLSIDPSSPIWCHGGKVYIPAGFDPSSPTWMRGCN